ncbi:MAG: class I SAM-dependent methyltransferase [Pirellulaceae bacterium]
MSTLQAPLAKKLIRIPGMAYAARKLLRRLFSGQDGVGVTLHDSDGVHYMGSTNSTLQVEIEVHSKQFYQRLLRRGDLGVAESYIAGEWSCSDLSGLFNALLGQTKRLKQLLRKFSWLGNLRPRILHSRRHNSLRNSRDNISKHYDLGNDFYKLFLDETLCYSSGLFREPEMTMLEASVEKMKKACDSLQLTADDHLLEIGTGWGALAIYAAENYGCRVTTTTISKEQLNYAQTRVSDSGLEDLVQVIDQDYRQLSGVYDKIVSIEMIEAVGNEYLEIFFQKCHSLLRSGGKMLLQSILMNDNDYEEYLDTVDFIRFYIFPGGSLPAMKRIDAINLEENLFERIDNYDMTSSYVVTLKYWLNSFRSKADECAKQGYDLAFQKLWEYYLEYCKAGFSSKHISVKQLLFERA